MKLLRVLAGRLCGTCGPRGVPLVLVVVVVVGCVAVPVMGVVDMVAMGDRCMPAAGFVAVVMAGMGQVRHRMLVDMIRMRGMGVAVVHVVDVACAFRPGVAAAWPVLVVMAGMNFVLGHHGSSLM